MPVRFDLATLGFALFFFIALLLRALRISSPIMSIFSTISLIPPVAKELKIPVEWINEKDPVPVYEVSMVCVKNAYLTSAQLKFAP